MQVDVHANTAQIYCIAFGEISNSQQEEIATAGEEDDTSNSQTKGNRFPISKDDAVTIAIALAASTLIRT